MNRVFLVLLVASFAAGCGYGMTAEKFRQTSSPQGVSTRIATPETLFRGELIEVQAPGLLILTSSSGPDSAPRQERLLRLVPYGGIRSATFDQLGGRYEISGGRSPSDTVRARLRLVSRFPCGLAPELLQQLLASCGQTEVYGVQP